MCIILGTLQIQLQMIFWEVCVLIVIVYSLNASVMKEDPLLNAIEVVRSFIEYLMIRTES